MEGRVRVGATIVVVCSIFLPLASAAIVGNKLKVGFYGDTCPQAEQIVTEVVTNAYKKDHGVAAGFLRLFFHDCFLNGCDASLLLDKTPSGEKVERESRANGINMRGLEVIDEAKARLESECPGIVSCADLLSFAARDGSVKAGVPHYNVAAGRRDGLVSLEKDVSANIPLPSWPLRNITELFVRKGMTIEDMVILIGSHSVGIAHCPTFAYRIAKYNATVEIDPKLNKADTANIRNACQRPVPFEELAKTFLPFDPITPFKMDSVFYKHLTEGKGLIESDRAMADDPATKHFVKQMASNERDWLLKFSRAMIRLGMVDVKTGTEGEIRENCRFVNPAKTQDSGNNHDDSDNTHDDSGNSYDNIDKEHGFLPGNDDYLLD